MDQSRRFIATASDRPEDIVEKADTEIILIVTGSEIEAVVGVKTSELIAT